MQLSVINATTATPLLNPTDGDTYIVAAGASGDWVRPRSVYRGFDKTFWTFRTPIDGWLYYITNEDQLYRCLTGWVVIPDTNTLPQLGINGTANASNKLYIQSEGIVFNHVGSH